MQRSFSCTRFALGRRRASCAPSLAIDMARRRYPELGRGETATCGPCRGSCGPSSAASCPGAPRHFLAASLRRRLSWSWPSLHPRGRLRDSGREPARTSPSAVRPPVVSSGTGNVLVDVLGALTPPSRRCERPAIPEWTRREPSEVRPPGRRAVRDDVRDVDSGGVALRPRAQRDPLHRGIRQRHPGPRRCAARDAAHRREHRDRARAVPDPETSGRAPRARLRRGPHHRVGLHRVRHREPAVDRDPAPGRRRAPRFVAHARTRPGRHARLDLPARPRLRRRDRQRPHPRLPHVPLGARAARHSPCSAWWAAR